MEANPTIALRRPRLSSCLLLRDSRGLEHIFRLKRICVPTLNTFIYIKKKVHCIWYLNATKIPSQGCDLNMVEGAVWLGISVSATLKFPKQRPQAGVGIAGDFPSGQERCLYAA